MFQPENSCVWRKAMERELTLVTVRYELVALCQTPDSFLSRAHFTVEALNKVIKTVDI
jgi:hypothetical protein